jgi:hypothetical protein
MQKLSWVALVGLLGCGSVSGGIDANNHHDAPRPVDSAVDAAAPDATSMTMFTSMGSWSCAVNVDCEDTFDFVMHATSSVTVTVTGVTGNSVPRIGLFAGAMTTGTNLMNNTAADNCGTQNTNLTGGPITLAMTGPYRLAIGRDWLKSAGATGNYMVSLTSTVNFSGGAAVANDQASNQAHCP